MRFHTARQIQHEMGIETAQAYFQHHRDALAILRTGSTPAPQSALHGNRARYTPAEDDSGKARQ